MLRKRSVLFLIDGLPVGGSEIFLLNLLKGLDRQLISPVVVTLGPESDPIFGRIPPDVPKYSHARNWKFDLSPAEAISRLIADDDIDTIFCIGFFSYFFARHALRNGERKVRIIISLHSTKPRSVKEYLLKAAIIQLLTGSEEIITVCTNQQEYFIGQYAIDRDRFTTIHNGVDTSFWTPPPGGFDRGRERESLGIARDALVFLNVAMFRWEKRHDILVEAFRRMPGTIDGRPLFLVFVGNCDTRLQSEIRDRVRKAGLESRITFAGLQEDVRKFYWISDVFTLASSSGETLSLAALEALSTGLPVVLTDIGGANEIVSEGVNGYLVRPGSAEELATVWMKGAEKLRSFDRGRIRDDLIKRFELRDCIGRYQRILAGPTAMDRSAPEAAIMMEEPCR